MTNQKKNPPISTWPLHRFSVARVAQNPDERFDVVDENDRVVRQERRAVVHATGLRHRAVHVFVFNAAGQLFLQKRSMAKDMSPGLWDSSCSGHLDAGEDYDTAARRELGEELGLVLARSPERWLRLEACEQTGWEFCWVYRAQAEGPFVLHPQEIETGAWYFPQELAQRIAQKPGDYCPAFSLIWSKVSPDLLK